MPSVYSVSSLCQINFQGFKETWDRQAGWRLERCDGDQKSDCRRPPSVAVIWWSDSLTRARPAYKVVMLTKSPWRNEEPDVGDCLISSYVKMDLVPLRALLRNGLPKALDNTADTVVSTVESGSCLRIQFLIKENAVRSCNLRLI